MIVTPWTESSHQEFAQAKVRWGEPLAYEESWLYLSQALRRGGWILSGSEGWLAVARDYLGIGEHAAVVPMAAQPAEFIAAAVPHLAENGIDVKLVKHVPKVAAEDLVSCGLFETANRNPDSTPQRLEELSEDTFPQILINITQENWIPEHIVSSDMIPETLSGGRAKDFRYQVRRFWRHNVGRMGRVVVDDLLTVGSDVIEVALHHWIESVRLRFGSGTRPKVDDFNAVFTAPVAAVVRTARASPEPAWGELVSVDGVPRAIWVGQTISNQCFGVYGLVADTRTRNLSDFTLLRALLAAKDSGSRVANLGGSELSSLFAFKSKPIRSWASLAGFCRRVVDLPVRASARMPR